MGVHKMLEAFRDDAIYERAVRDVASRSNSSWHVADTASLASAKEYLFAKFMGEALEGSADEEEDEQDHEDTAEDAKDNNDPTAEKRKSSHRQRKRMAKAKSKFYATIPRTPSDGSA